MILADLGAEVVRVQRPDATMPTELPIEVDATYRGRCVVEADLQDSDDVASVSALIDAADVVVEGFRPGVTERLGLGPGVCLHRNPGLVYARVTGWGQEGPWAPRVGHDLNYLSVTGVLDNIGEPGGAPLPPLSLVGEGPLVSGNVERGARDKHARRVGPVLHNVRVRGRQVHGCCANRAIVLCAACSGAWAGVSRTARSVGPF